MTPEEKELLKLKDDIKEDLKDLFKKYLKTFDHDIPEANDREAAVLIVTTMQNALEELKCDIVEGKYDHF